MKELESKHETREDVREECVRAGAALLAVETLISDLTYIYG